jgi:uncharacterized membrane protein YhfC
MLYVTYTLNFLLMIGLPFVLAAFLARRLGTRWGLVWVGAITFILSQVAHFPLLYILGQLGVLKAATAGWPLVWYAVVLGLMAGLCEELARYLVLRFWLKRDRSWNAALMFGTGHGGVEAVIIGALTAIGAVNIFVLRNVDPAQLGVPADKLPALQAQIAAAWNVPVLYPLVGAFERVSAISTHLFLAVLVMQVFTRRSFLWLAAAILWHALTDALAVFAISTWGVLPTEAIIAGLALIGLGLMFALRQPEPPAVEATPGAAGQPQPPAAAALPAQAATAELLDRTRYQ